MPDFMETENLDELSSKEPISAMEQFEASHWLDLLLQDFQNVLDPDNFSEKFDYFKEICTKLQERITSSDEEKENPEYNVIKLCEDDLLQIKEKYKEFYKLLEDLSEKVANIEEDFKYGASSDVSALDDAAHLAKAFDDSKIPLFKKYAKALDIAINYYALDKKSLNEDEIDLVALAARDFDRSSDPMLIKQANVLDELLLTLSAPKDYLSQYKVAEEKEIQRIRAKNRESELDHLYKDVKKKLDEHNKVADTSKALSKVKEYRPLEAPLSTRYCPDHPGISVINLGENSVQCPLDRKIYNWTSGFETMKGNKIPGGGVEYQTPDYGSNIDGQMMFDTRDSLMTRAADAYLNVLEKKIS